MSYISKFLLVLIFLISSPLRVFSSYEEESANALRTSLVAAQLAVANADSALATKHLDDAKKTLDNIKGQFDKTSIEALDSSISKAYIAINNKSLEEFSILKGEIWSTILFASYSNITSYILNNEPEKAAKWLKIREYKKPTRFSTIKTDATVAIEQLKDKKLTSKEAVTAVQSDLLDTYQSHFLKTWEDLKNNPMPYKKSELRALALGYFKIFEKEYKQQKGEDKAALLKTILESGDISKAEELLEGFKAAPLSRDEKYSLARQFQRFVSLISIEYSRGIKDGKVHKDFELMEAISFRDAAQRTYKDLEGEFLQLAPKEQVTAIKAALENLRIKLDNAAKETKIEEPSIIQQEVDSLLKSIKSIIPDKWLQRTTASDFEEIASNLDQMERAIAEGQYELAETYRLESYAILDTGPEAKLIAFAPQYIPKLENIFWYGSLEEKGLARLIKDKSTLPQLKEARTKLDQLLAESQKALGGTSSSNAIITNSAIIVFREGLEAVLIIAAMLAGFHRQNYNHLKKPLIWGVVAAFFATILTWIIARYIISSLSQYGETLEAIISLFAVIVLLLITNWFFHKSYWTGWLQNFQAKKWTIAKSGIGQYTGMVLLGFDSVYREGFETVLFLQSLVLDGGSLAVLTGTAIGMLGVVIIGIFLFKIQVKLPYKKMLVFTGALIVSVLISMVGSTVHSFQVLGWMSTSPIRGLELPYWLGMWFGTYPTWEGILLQIFSTAFVLGSYFLATYLNRKKDEKKRLDKNTTTLAHS